MGIHKIKKRLASGSVLELHYHRGVSGVPAFWRSDSGIAEGGSEYQEALESALQEARRREAARLDEPRVRSALAAAHTASRKRAARKGVAHSISVEFLFKLYKDQRGRCACSGMRLRVEKSRRHRVGPYAPTIDRINPADGYVPSNVRILSMIANTAINEWGEEEFVKLCRAVAWRAKAASSRPSR